MSVNFFSRSTLLIAMTALCFACGKETDVDKVADAQDCLNKADSSTALSCMDKVTGMETESAYLIRCAAYFKDQSFGDPTVIAKVSQSMEGSGDNSVNALMSVLAFKKYTDATTNLDFCQKAMTACQASGSKGMVILASLSRIATETLVTANLLGPNPSADDVKSAMCGPAAPTAIIGAATLVAYNQGCVGDVGTAKNPFCEKVKAVASSGDAITVGTLMKNDLCNP